MSDEPAAPGAQGEPLGRLGDQGGASSGRWRQQAGFSVFFDSRADDTGEPVWRIRLYHEETGEETTAHAGAPRDWVRWIAERVGPLTDPPEAGSSEPGTVSVQVLNARIIAGPRIGAGVEDLRVTADLLVSGLTGLRRALPPTVIEIVFEAPAS